MANKSYIYIGTSLLAVALVYGYLQMQSSPGPLIDASDKQLVNKGRTIYQTYCATCHGINLQGETENWREVKEDGTLPAPPHDETGHTWHHDDQLLFDYTKNGGAAMVPEGFQSAMPAFGNVLSDKEIRASLSFIKSRWPKEIQDRQSQRNKPMK